MLVKRWVLLCTLLYIRNVAFSNVLPSLGRSTIDRSNLGHQLRYPEPFNQLLHFPESDDHPNEPPEVKGEVENGEGDNATVVDSENDWRNDDDEEPLGKISLFFISPSFEIWMDSEFW